MNNPFIRSITLCGASILAMSMSTATFAQTAGEADASAKAADAQDEAARDDEIIVTGVADR